MPRLHYIATEIIYHHQLCENQHILSIQMGGGEQSLDLTLRGPDDTGARIVVTLVPQGTPTRKDDHVPDYPEWVYRAQVQWETESWEDPKTTYVQMSAKQIASTLWIQMKNMYELIQAKHNERILH